MTVHLNNVKKLEERIAPAALGFPPGYDICGPIADPDASIGANAHSNAGASPNGAMANANASANFNASANGGPSPTFASADGNASGNANVETSSMAAAPTMQEIAARAGVINLVDPGDGTCEWHKF